MKKTFTTLMFAIAATMTVLGVEPPSGSFTWGIQVPLQMDYLSSETLSVASPTITQYNVAYELMDTSMSHYISINGDVVTVLNHYAGDNELTSDKIFIRAKISGMAEYDDTELTTYIKTRKIYPTMQWNCTLGDMLCGSTVKLSAIHGNTDRPNMEVTYYAADDVSSPSSLVTIDQTTDQMRAIKIGNGVYVTAKIDSTENYKAKSITYFRDDSVVRFNIIKGYRTITWNSADFANLNNLSQGTELHTQYFDNQDSVKYSTSDLDVAEIVNGNYLKVNGPGRVTISAFVKGNDNYYDSQSDTVIDIPIVATVIYWEENVVEGQKAMITSTAKDYNLNVLTGSNYANGTFYHFSSSDTTVAKVFGDTLLTCYKMGSFDLSAYAFNLVGGQSATITRSFDAIRGYMKFVKEGKWSDRNNWERSDLEPSKEDYSVEILAKCTIPNGETASCYDLDIYTQGGIVVEPEGVLYVENTLENNAGEEQLVIKADRHKQGAVYFKQGAPNAKVEVWMDMSYAAGKDTVWAYKGIPVDTTSVRNASGQLKVYQYSESKGWSNITSMMPQLRGWEAYRMADTMPSTYTFEGRLNAGVNHKFELGYENEGKNIIVNSYSAPIDIRAIEFDGAFEELHYPIGQQWGCAPKYTAAAIGERGKMMSGDAMFVQAEVEGAIVTMDYEKNILGDFAEEEFNVLKVIITGAKYSDTVSLIGCAGCSGYYENGYDGTKWLGPDTMPQIFASNDWGRASVNAEQSIIGQNIGVIAANDADLYNITFDTKRLRGYDQLYLFDMKTQTYVDILAGQPYGFSTTRLGEEKRFTIMRDKIEAKKDKYGHGFVVAGNRVLLVGFGNEHQKVRICNAAGVVVYEFWSDEGPWVELPELLNGVYIINSGVSYTKFYR